MSVLATTARQRAVNLLSPNRVTAVELGWFSRPGGSGALRYRVLPLPRHVFCWHGEAFRQEEAFSYGVG